VSLVIGVPFRDGVLVASDLGWATRIGEPKYGMSKLHMAGEALFSLTGRVKALHPDGRVVGSVADAVVAAAPDVDAMAQAAAGAMREQVAVEGAISRDWGDTDGTRLAFWSPDRVVHFALSPDGAIERAEVSLEPERGWRFFWHGSARYANDHVLRAGRLALASRVLLRYPSRAQISCAQALAFATDVIETTERTLQVVPPEPWTVVGGGVDARVVPRAPASPN
jgi:hypothetical protein